MPYTPNFSFSFLSSSSQSTQIGSSSYLCTMEGLFILLLSLSLGLSYHSLNPQWGAHSSEVVEKKNTENCRSENVSFPVLWFIQWEHFFLILWCEKLFFAFISSSTPLFFHHRWCVSECFWIFFLESCIVLWVMRTLKWTFVHVSVFNWFSFLIRKMFCIRNCKS